MGFTVPVGFRLLLLAPLFKSHLMAKGFLNIYPYLNVNMYHYLSYLLPSLKDCAPRLVGFSRVVQRSGLHSIISKKWKVLNLQFSLEKSSSWVLLLPTLCKAVPQLV